MSKQKPIILAADHGGYELHLAIKSHLESRGIPTVVISGKEGESTDYPLVAKRAVDAVLARGTRGIFVCGSGIGISIAANRFRGIRAALVHSEVYAQLARQHNDANVMCLGGRFLEPAEANRLVDIFLETEFEGGRHTNRVRQMCSFSGR